MDDLVKYECARLEKLIQQTTKKFQKSYQPDDSRDFNGFYNDDFNININDTVGDISLNLLMLVGGNIGVFISESDKDVKLKALISIFMYQYVDIMMLYFYHVKINSDKSFLFLKDISMCVLLGVVLGRKNEVYILGKIIESFKHNKTYNLIIGQDGDEVSDISLAIIDVFLNQEISSSIKSELYGKTKSALLETMTNDSYFEYIVRFHNLNSGQSNDKKDYVIDNVFYVVFPVLILSIVKINEKYESFFKQKANMIEYCNLIKMDYVESDVYEYQKLKHILSIYSNDIDNLYSD